MLIQRLYLRNFRVYEDELDLDLPPGLVGIYGPNGAGKSTLLEAILWTLWGKARTTKEQIRSSGVGGECVTEVEFEHEGHLYLVRRVLKGINSSVTVEAHCDGALMSTGTRDAETYIESVLGMDDAAFRASVFTEQKQLAAFSNHSPAERRRLVLQLLGITPLDTARDAARKDARDLTSTHEEARKLLADLAALETEAADNEARAGAAETVSTDEQRAAQAAAEKLAAAVDAYAALDVKRQEHDALVIEGKGARQEADGFRQSVAEQRRDLDQLESESKDLSELDAVAAGLAHSEQELSLLAAAHSASSACARIAVPDRPAQPDEARVEDLRRAAGEAREKLAALDAMAEAASAAASRAKDAVARSSSLTGEADCPVCGQALGDAFETVQAHRASELAEAERRATEAGACLKEARNEAAGAEKRYSKAAAEAEQARKLWTAWERADEQRREAEAATRSAWEALLAIAPERATPEGAPPTIADLATAVEGLRSAADQQRAAMKAAERIRVRMERKPALERSIAINEEKAEAADARLQALRNKVKKLDFDSGALELAAKARTAAETVSRAASAKAQEVALEAARARERANSATEKLAVAREQHTRLATLESDSRHVARVADLLSEFRNTVVASVGPKLAVHAADLFGELTDHEYEGVEVDGETYQIQISDGGRLFGLDRFSGSEIDLANLALRVAISEHIHFQSGGSVGLLVLDEVFGPLDEDRKARMLLALERLRGRFRQVLVVTHDVDIKEQLPNALEVVKLPGRRATARVVGD